MPKFTDEEIRDSLKGPDVWVSWDNRVDLPDTENGGVFLEGRFTARQLRMLLYLIDRTTPPRPSPHPAIPESSPESETTDD